MMALFERLGDPHLQMIGEWSVGAALFHLGALEAGHQHLEKALTLYDPAFHGARVWQTGIEPGIFCRCELSRTTDAARLSRHGARPRAGGGRRRARARSSAAAGLRAALRDLHPPRPAQRRARSSAPTSSSPSSVTRTASRRRCTGRRPLVGRAFIELGDLKRGLRVLEEGLAAHTTTRSALLRPYYLVLLAGAQLRAGNLDRAQASLDESTRVADATGQHAYDAEHARLQAEVHGAARRGRRRRTQVSRRARDLAPAGRALARAPRGARLRPSPRRARPRRPKPATSCSPSCRGSPKAATRWTTFTPRGSSGRSNDHRGSGSQGSSRFSSKGSKVLPEP